MSNSNPKSIILGAGEVGSSLYVVLKETYKKKVMLKDKEANRENSYISADISFLNICYPYDDSFIKNTQDYIQQYKPSVATIIHSTVPVGTTRKCGQNCVHSPIHGKHPNLEDGIKTFVKYIGGGNNNTVYQAKHYLEKAGIPTKTVSSPEASELSKILCTTYYGWNIIFVKEVASICDDLGLSFKEVYIDWNKEYNKGYTKLGIKQVVRPILVPIKGSIGGHCIINNCELIDSFITNLIKKRDKKYELSNSNTNPRQIP
jgi:UDP-N-acetyl-D-mannosaminuronate dehydrogenase